MAANKFSLNWKDFETNMSTAFKELREEKDFFDVTIACEDSQIQAHKVILSACSTFFRNILRRNPHQHPLLYLRGIKYKELLSILNFMYNGEVNVAQEELKQFLSIAADLQVKGPTQKMETPSHSNTVTTTSSTPTHNISPKALPQKRQMTENNPPNKKLCSTNLTNVKPLTPMSKESPKSKDSQENKSFQTTTPVRVRQDRIPPPNILEHCIMEAEINNGQAGPTPQVDPAKPKKTMMRPPLKGDRIPYI